MNKSIEFYENIKQENVLYLDIETQYLITDFPGGWKNEESYKKARIAELGILYNGVYETYEEDNILELYDILTTSDLIVGHNIINFDFNILKYYYRKECITSLLIKSFDTMLEFNKFTKNSGWVSLDDISRRNFEMNKTEDTLKIPEMWRNGEKEKVREYLLNDLKMTEKIFLSGKKGYTFKYDHKIYGKSHGEKEVYVKWGLK